jgi:cyclin D3
MSYLPSVVAAATMLHVVNTVEPCLLVEYQSQLLGILGIDKVRKKEKKSIFLIIE